MADEPFEFFDYTTGVPLKYCSGEKIAEKRRDPSRCAYRGEIDILEGVLKRFTGSEWIICEVEEGMCVLSHDMKDTYKYYGGKWLKWKDEFFGIVVDDMNEVSNSTELYNIRSWWGPENIVDDQYKKDELNFVHPDSPFNMPVYVKYDGDLFVLQSMKPSVALSTVDDLMNRDKQREKDGFLEKSRWERLSNQVKREK